MGNNHQSVMTVSADSLTDFVFKGSSIAGLHGPGYKLFHINRLEDVRQSVKFSMIPHRKTVNDFILITQGGMIRQRGLNQYTFGAPSGGGCDCFFLPAHQISLDKWMSDDIRGYYCHFDTVLLTKRWQKQDLEREFTFLNFANDPVVSIDSETSNHILPLLDRLWSEYQKKRNDSVDLFRIYLLALFFELKQMAGNQAQITSKPAESMAIHITQLYKNALNQYIYEKQLVGDYADLLRISPNHLNKCVKVATGQSARELLDEMLLMEAKVMLTQTQMSISEVAYKLGSQDPSNFSRFFKNKLGVSPREFQLMD